MPILKSTKTLVHRSLCLVSSGATLLASGACGKDAPRAPAQIAVTPVGDGGSRVQAEDASSGPDAGANGTTIITRTGKLLCSYAELDARQFEGNRDHPAASIAGSPGGFGLVYWDSQNNLQIQAADRGGYVDESIPIAAANEGIRAIQLSATGDDYVLAKVSEVDGKNVLSTASLAQAAGSKSIHGGAIRKGLDGGRLWDMIPHGSGFLLAYVDEQLRIQQLDSTGREDGERATIDGLSARGLANLQVARLDDGQLLLAWHELDDMGNGRIMSQQLTSSFKVAGGLTQLSKNAVSKTRFDLAARAHSAGLIYENLDAEVRDAIKFRRIEPDGAPSGPLLNIVSAPKRAVDGQVADFGQGYAVAYRLQTSLGVTEPEIHVAFVNQFGKVVHDALLAKTTAEGGPVSIGTTPDGHILLSWTESNDFATSRSAFKLHCPGALLLCGGEIE